MRSALILFILSFKLVAIAEWTFKPQAGLAFTDNANYDESNKETDFYWWIGNTSLNVESDSTWSVYFNYKDYLHEDHNDLFSYQIARSHDQTPTFMGTFDWFVSLGGQNYSSGSPAESEETFSNIYLETSLLKTRNLRSDIEYSLEPGYQFKNFTDLSGRNDHLFFFEVNLYWDLKRGHTLNPTGGLGFVFSSDDIYSRYYLDFGVEWRFEQNPKTKYGLSFSQRFSSYTDREISTVTAVSKGKGGVVMGTSNESHSLVLIEGYLSKVLTQKQEVKSGMMINTLKTRSGIGEYTEIVLYSSIIIHF